MRSVPLSLLVAVSSLTVSPSCSKREPPAAQARDAQAAAPAEDLPAYRVFDSAAEALAALLESSPRVIGFGEIHQTTANMHVPSALQRFTGEMLDVLGPAVSDLIVETWVQDGACGAKEQQVGADIQTTTRRPHQTEDQVLALIERARHLDIRPHVLALRCEDYDMLQGEDGEVDYEKLLALVTRELRATTARVLARRDRAGHDAGVRDARQIIAVYGGSLHNDLHPYEVLAAYSYAGDIARQAGDRYLEVDLYVPELVEGKALLATESWYPLLDRVTGPDRVVLVERSARSFILLLPRSPPAPAQASPDRLPSPPAAR